MSKLSDQSLLESIRRRQTTIYSLSTFENSLIMDQMASSKMTRRGVRRLGAHTTVMNDPYVQKRAAQPFKRYEGAVKYDLAQYRHVELKKGLTQLAAERFSVKSYNGEKVSTMHLGAILSGSYGFTRTEALHDTKIPWHFRPTPSPGGLFATEIYVILINSDLPQGLYHYRPDIDALELLKTGNFSDFVAESCGAGPYIEAVDMAGGMIIFTSVIERLFIKYSDRSYKFMLIETGMVSQQATLALVSIGLGSCMLGGYFDDEVHSFLGIDGVLESVQNVMIFGHPKKTVNGDE